MIWKVLLTTFLLLLAYSLFITVFRANIHRTAQTIEQRNVVKAEEFLYENEAQTDTIVVGSSMTNRLLFDSLSGHKGHYYNLGLGGMASVDGLELIAQAKYCPKLVLVEINTLDRVPDPTFISRFTQPGWSQIRKYISFMRLKYQPVGVVKALLRDWRGDVSENLVETVDTAFVTKLVRERLSQMRNGPQDNDLQRTVDEAGVLIQALRKRGTKVVLFEMPIDSRIRSTDGICRLRRLVTTTFPDSVYRHIPFPNEFYQTTDGVHLPRYECIRYSRYLCAQIAGK